MREGNLTEELRSVAFGTYPEVFAKFRSLSERYGGLSQDSIISAFTRVTGQGPMLNNPYIQNRRVKAISSLPADFTKDQVGEMLRSPDANEQALRRVEQKVDLEASEIIRHLRKILEGGL